MFHYHAMLSFVCMLPKLNVASHRVFYTADTSKVCDTSSTVIIGKNTPSLANPLFIAVISVVGSLMSIIILGLVITLCILWQQRNQKSKKLSDV